MQRVSKEKKEKEYIVQTKTRMMTLFQIILKKNGEMKLKLVKHYCVCFIYPFFFGGGLLLEN